MKKILIVDDDVDISVLIDVLLRNMGYETVVANSPSIFTDLVAINPDLILLDNRLDNGYGKDYCKQLKMNPTTSRFKIVLVSAAPDISTASAECKADAFLSKPFELSSLTELIADMTGNPN